MPFGRWRWAGALVAAGLLAAGLCGAATAEPDPLFDDAESAPSRTGFPDPFERFNRVVFRFNLGVDRWVLEPVAHGYAFAVPAPGRRAVRRVLGNLGAPAVFVNDVLQIEPADAGVTAARFVLNTTVGLAGLLDVGGALGLEGHQSDFGQTLALYGVPSGPYLILPAIGPTTMRDGTGYLVDMLFRPTTYFLTWFAFFLETGIQETSTGIAAREVHGAALHALRASSMDYYAALRSAFYQDRIGQIWARREHRRPAVASAGP